VLNNITKKGDQKPTSPVQMSETYLKKPGKRTVPKIATNKTKNFVKHPSLIVYAFVFLFIAHTVSLPADMDVNLPGKRCHPFPTELLFSIVPIL